jgi:hypothetical protein
MTWTKLGGEFRDDPKLLTLPRGIRLLHVEALTWSNEHTTDGEIPRHALSRITDEPKPEKAAALLASAGLWQETENGWAIVDFLVDQLSAAKVRKDKQLTAARQRRFKLHGLGDHSECLRSCRYGSSNAAGNASTNGVSTGTQSGRPSGRPAGREDGRTTRPNSSVSRNADAASATSEEIVRALKAARPHINPALFRR